MGAVVVAASLGACSAPRNTPLAPGSLPDGAMEVEDVLPAPPLPDAPPAPDRPRDMTAVETGPAPVDTSPPRDLGSDPLPPPMASLPCAPGACRPTRLAAQGTTSCAVIAEGRVACWGAGVIGASGENYSNRPRLVPGLTRALHIGVGSGYACALVEGGAVRCWGRNFFGQLGDGTMNDAVTPSTVIGLGTVTGLTVGGDHACALVGPATWCWGSNGEGQLGEPSGMSAFRPVRVNLPGAASAIAAGGSHTCAILGSAVVCWGSNRSGQLTPTMMPESSATPVTIAAGPALDIAAGYSHTCVITSEGGAPGAIRCWGANFHGQSAPSSQETYVGPTTTAIAGPFRLGLGLYHTCVLAANNVARCWGDNSYGQIGNGDPGARMLDANVNLTGPAAGVSFTQVVAGTRHTCALASGRVFCWGQNDRGQVGDGTFTDAATPTPVVDL